MIELTNEFLIRVLIFILVCFISFTALFKVFGERGVSLIISMVISIFAVFYLSPEQIIFAGKTYGFMGIFVALLIPLMIVFFFIYMSELRTGFRRFFWVFYGIMSLVLFQSVNNLSSDNSTLVILGIIIKRGREIIRCI